MDKHTIGVFVADIINCCENGYSKELHPLIGRRYKPMDNSYIKDIASGIERGVGLYGREVIIVSEPYVEMTSNGTKRLFVKVFSTDSEREYRVLFDEGWLID